MKISRFVFGDSINSWRVYLYLTMHIFYKRTSAPLCRSARLAGCNIVMAVRIAWSRSVKKPVFVRRKGLYKASPHTCLRTRAVRTFSNIFHHEYDFVVRFNGAQISKISLEGQRCIPLVLASPAAISFVMYRRGLDEASFKQRIIWQRRQKDKRHINSSTACSS